LFKNLVNEKGTGALQVYSSELDRSEGGVDPDVLMQDRLKKGKERLDLAVESVALLCEPVEPPKDELEHIRYFCGNTEIADDLLEREPQRVALYKGVVALIRAYANISDEMEPAGFRPADINRIKKQLEHYLDVREIIRKASGENIDMKAYEADMRHLIDTYIDADEPRKISPFDNMGLLELIVKTGMANAIGSQLGGLKGNKNAISETIENNVRRKIIKEHLNDPAYYEMMSALLDEIIASRKAKAIEYEEYLRQVADLARRVEVGQSDDAPEALKHSPGLRAVYNNLKRSEASAHGDVTGEKTPAYSVAEDKPLKLAVAIDTAVKSARHDEWRGNQPREQAIKAALFEVLQDTAEVERVFLIIKQHRSEY
jgi:type I restriction enzyme R subunit